MSGVSEIGAPMSELEAEQAYVDRAHACLEATRRRVREFWERVAQGREGTHAARFERDVLEHRVFQRLGQLELGGRSLCFGRIDLAADGNGDESFYVGRIGVWDEDQSAVVCDWRAPVAEPFFRATGRQPLGLARRRRFVSRGSRLLGFDDEHFSPDGLDLDDADVSSGGGELENPALQAVLEAPRTGRIGDATATIQAEQDDVIRAPLSSVLIVQGGPGTGKTVVALHRAAYLIYTHRFPLAGQGVLVIGPNPVFLTYVEQILPSLGEAGVRLATLGDLLNDVVVKGDDSEPVARTKGDARMADVLRRAVRTRQRPLREPLVMDHGLQRLRLSTEASAAIVARARRRARTHNGGRRFVVAAFFQALAGSVRRPLAVADLADALGETLEVRRALDWMWPVLTPAQLLHDLYGSRALLRKRHRRCVRRGRDGGSVPPTPGARRRRDLDHRRRACAGRGAHAAGVADSPRHRLGDPHVRPHRGGRGAGSLTHAVAHGGSALAQRVPHAGRRHSSGHQRLGTQFLGKRGGVDLTGDAAAFRRVDDRLPASRSRS